MASFNQPVPYSHYPSSASTTQHADRPVPDDGPGSFGPVLVVMAVISFLAVAACVAGRLCGRGSSSRGSSSGQQSAEADKGLGAKHLEVMRPLPSSRATVHDVDDAFEIRLVPQTKPAGSEASGGIIRLQALPELPLPQPQLGAPRQYPAAAAGGVGFRVPAASANTGAARQAHPLYGSRAASFVPAQQRR
ncbi:hypothetical protein SETIT_4G148500v2 [Setaria italica]|uniref:Uncharacterized protein n=2 Tax=Setaria italica TaxID=4555 RepID=A0A368QUI9_SETIT|nr:hypothetical protein SETIT_4G148500v2 [Setaria italica]